MNLHCHSDSDFLKDIKGVCDNAKNKFILCNAVCLRGLKGSSDARFPQVDMIF